MKRVGISVAGALLALTLVAAPVPAVADEAVVDEGATEVVVEDESDEVADDEQAEHAATAEGQEAPQGQEALADEAEAPLGAAVDEGGPLETAAGGEAEPLEAAIEDEADPLGAGETVNVYRLYNWRSSEHLYTTSKGEYDNLPRKSGGDWMQEGVAWVAPKTSNTPVYRLYNPKSGDHHYTTSKGERDALVAKHGWRYESVAFYSDDAHRVALYRVYNGRLRRGQHHYTTSAVERDSLVAKSGWRDEGTGFYAVKKGSPKPPSASTIPAGTYIRREWENEFGFIVRADGSCSVICTYGMWDEDDCFEGDFLRIKTGIILPGKELSDYVDIGGSPGEAHHTNEAVGKGLRASSPNNFVVKFSDGTYFWSNFWLDPSSKELYWYAAGSTEIGDWDNPLAKLGSYVLPDSSKRLYSSSELYKLSSIELWIARNEIYARHGRKFTNAWLQDYFNTKPWYSGKYSPSEYDVGGVPKVYNDYEGGNRNLIAQIESEKGSPY